MSLGIDLTKALRSRLARADLVVHIRDAPESEQETNWLEWKSGLDLAAKATEAVIAKAITGFANRDPDIAARALEGCAYLVLGVEPGKLTGVTPIDQAKLEAGIAVYVGQNVGWDAAYAEVDGVSVLVVTVEPPSWADPIRCFRKAYLPGGKDQGIPAGTIFVRHSASTERATPDDIDMLSRRAGRQPGSELEIDVQAAHDTEVGRVDSRSDTISLFAAREERRLLQSLATFQAQPMHPALSLLAAVESRTEQRFRQEVSFYAERIREEMPGVLLARSVLHNVGLLDLRVVNPTDATYASVQVEAWFPGPVEICAWEFDARQGSAPPESPPEFGQGGASWSANLLALSQTLGLRPEWVPAVQRETDGVRVVFDPVDVRASGSKSLDRIWLMLNHDAPSTIEVQWQATAKNARKRLSGTIVVPVREALVALEELLADPPED